MSRVQTTLLIIFLLFGLIAYSFYWHTLNYVLFAPNQYIVYNLKEHQIELFNKYSSTELLWKDSTSLDVSNSIEIEGKLLFIVNYVDKADLVVFDIASKNLVNQIPLAGAKGVRKAQVSLLGNTLYIKCLTYYSNIEEYKVTGEYKEWKYELEYIVPIRAILNHQVNTIKPVNVEDLGETIIGGHYLGGPVGIFDDFVFLENRAQDKERTLYEYGNTKVNYIADGKIVQD